MKKLIVLICMVLCVAVIGSVLAIAVYPAGDLTSSVGTDKYLYLTLAASDSTNVTLSKGIPQIIPISISIDSNDKTAEGAANWGTATLKINATSVGADKSIDKVSIGLYSDIAGKNPIEGEHVAATQHSITMTGITEGTTIYVKILLANDASESEVNNTNGELTCTLERAA